MAHVLFFLGKEGKIVEEARSGPRFRVRGSQRLQLPVGRERLRNSAESGILLGVRCDEPCRAPGKRAAA